MIRVLDDEDNLLPTAELAGPKYVELRGIEPLTYSMRTSRATNCAIAPDTGSTGYQPHAQLQKPTGLLPGSTR